MQTLLYSSTTANPFIFESYISDMDNDGQKDIISKIQDCGIVWFKNFGANVFSSPNAIGLPCPNGALSSIGDIDLDNNADMVTVGLKWRRNLGGGTFDATLTPVSTTSDAALSSTLFDIDNDGDLDLFYKNATQFAWHKNNSITLSSDEFNAATFTIYPNPSASEINITSQTAFDHYKIYDTNGRLLNDVTLPNLNTETKIDLNSISTGVYFLEIQTVTAKQLQKFIKN